MYVPSYGTVGIARLANSGYCGARFTGSGNCQLEKDFLSTDLAVIEFSVAVA